jgi:predicted permease
LHAARSCIGDAVRDAGYAVRSWQRHPGMTAAAIVTIALGVGVSTGIVSLVYAVLLRPLPYRDSDRIVQIAENLTRDSSAGPQYSRRFGMTQAEFVEWRARATSFTHMAGVINLMNGQWQTDEGPIAAPRAIVSPALFEMLGVPAQLGRTLLPEDERPDASAAVISAAAWQRFFGSDPAILGRPVVLNNTAFTIVGVMPAGFDYPEPATTFWTALAPRPGPGTNAFGNVIARLKDGLSIAAATDEANAIGPAVRVPPSPVGFGAAGAPPSPPVSATLGAPVRSLDLAGRPRFEVVRVKDLIVNPIRLPLRVLSLAAAIVLLIACTNVANLLLARATSRRREIGVRLAIGAGRGRIVRQMLTESLVLAMAGGVGGVAIAIGALQIVERLASVDTPRLFQLSINLGSGSLLPRVSEIGIDGPSLMAALIITSIAGVVFGAAPAFHAAATPAARVIGSAGLRGTPTGAHRLRSVLVFAQVSLATMLLVAAGLLAHSLLKLQNVDLGFDPRQVLTFQLSFPPPPPTGERQAAVIQHVIEQLQADPRVLSAGYTNIAPFLALTEFGGLFVPPGTSREAMLADPLRPQTRIVSHGYLEAIGSRLLDGRWLSRADEGTQPPVLVVNRALARRYFGAKSPVGALVRVFRGPDDSEDWRIVGVIEDLVQARVDEEPFPIVFADMRQVLAARQRTPKALQMGQALSGFPTIVVRTRASDSPTATEIRRIVRAFDPAVGVDAVVSLDGLHAGSLVRPRFYAVLVGLFASIAGALAALGIYAVLAFTVAQRTPEIGIRMALGATRRAVVADVLGDSVMVTAVAVVVGLAGAAAVTRALSSMLFGLTPLDLSTYLAVAFVLVTLAVLASAVPARRATRVDPVVALRTE